MARKTKKGRVLRECTNFTNCMKIKDKTTPPAAKRVSLLFYTLAPTLIETAFELHAQWVQSTNVAA